jgi:hypothetical protein
MFILDFTRVLILIGKYAPLSPRNASHVTQWNQYPGAYDRGGGPADTENYVTFMAAIKVMYFFIT